MSDKKDQSVADEQALARLLEAAYVVQEYNSAQKLNSERQAGRLGKDDRLREPESGDRAAVQPDAKSDYTAMLAQIVEIQGLFRDRRPDFENALALVAERVAQITKSNGAAVGIVDGMVVRYQAAVGSSSLPRGTEVPMEKALSFSCFRTGQPFRCPDVNQAVPLDAEECYRRGIQSMMAVPVYHEGKIAGVLEVYFGETHAFGEPDVHIGQLMAGLITEAFTRDSQGAWKESQAAERASMLDALEKLKPNLAALLEASTAKGATARSVGPRAVAAVQPFVCRRCGHQLAGEEQFCGKCGSPRISDSGSPSVQSKVASLQRMQEAHQQILRSSANGAGHPPLPSKSLEHNPAHADADDHEEEQPPSTEDDLFQRLAASEARLQLLKIDDPNAGVAAHPAGEGTEDLPIQEHLPSQLEAEPATDEQKDLEIHATETALTKTDGAVTWSSAAKARDFLEKLAVSQNRTALGNLWNARRGDIYLAVAILLMAGVIRWGLWSSHSVNATTRTGPAGAIHRRLIPVADLSLFDRLLISLGLAEAPDAPEYKGNPETQVWVDIHTALYYCPGAGLYGKTPKGKFTTQRDAQLDQFEPAYRKACD